MGLTALLDVIGARNVGRENAYQRQLQTRAQDLEQQRYTSEADIQRQDLEFRRQQANRAQTSEDAKLASAGRTPAGQYIPLALPKNLTQILPDNKGRGPKPGSAEYATAESEHYARVANQYAQAGRMDEANYYAALSRDSALNASTLAGAAYTQGPRTDLTRSQADLTRAKTEREKHWREEINLKFQQKMQEVRTRQGASAAAAMQRTMANIGSRREIAQMGEDARTAIAMQTAINHANGVEEQQAFQVALHEYTSAENTWMRAQEAASKGTPLPGYDYNQPQPSLPQFIMNMGQPAAPSVQVEVINTPSGQKTIQVVKTNLPGTGAGGGAGGGARPSAAAQVQHARAQGVPDAKIRSGLSQHGYSQAEIDAALGPAARATIPVRPQAPTQVPAFLNVNNR